MYTAEIVLQNKTGLHARPASQFVTIASKFHSDIFVIKDDKEYNAKSMMGVLSMGAGSGTKLIIKAEGLDEKEAVEELERLVHSNFGE